jgi:hypothetical protein
VVSRSNGVYYRGSSNDPIRTSYTAKNREKTPIDRNLDPCSLAADYVLAKIRRRCEEPANAHSDYICVTQTLDDRTTKFRFRCKITPSEREGSKDESDIPAVTSQNDRHLLSPGDSLYGSDIGTPSVTGPTPARREPSATVEDPARYNNQDLTSGLLDPALWLDRAFKVDDDFDSSTM